MASPFAIFRKNQKLMMVALTILAMVAFVLSDAFDFRGLGSGGTSNPVVVESEYFKLHDSQLAQAMANHEIVHRYMVQAVSMALEQEQMRMLRTQMPQQVSMDQLRQFIRYEDIARQAVNYADGRFGPVSERSVVETLTLADYGTRMGIQVGDDQVRDFISQTVQGLLTSDQLNAVMQSIGGRGGKITIQQLVDAFRTAIVADTVRRWFTNEPARIATPVDRWNYYLRKECRASAEVLPVRTADLVGEIKDPSNSELTEFYDKYRFFEPVPGSPDPGFKIPRRAAFQYAVAETASFYHPEKVTADEIAAFYDKNKTRYPYTAENFNEPAKKADEKGTTEEKTETDAKPQADKKPKPTAKKSADKAKQPTRVEADCGADGEDEGTSCDAAPEEEPKKDEPKKEDDAQKDAAAGPTLNTPASPTAAASPATTSTATPTASIPAAPVLPPDPLPTDDWQLPGDVRSGRTPQYDPLWKVEQKIREDLGRKAAEEEVKAVFAKLRDDLINKALSRDITSDKPLFTDEQWVELVGKYPGLTGKTTPVMTDVEARQASEQPGFFRSTVGGMSLAEAAYAETAVYVPKESLEFPDVRTQPDRNDGAPQTTHYLYWKILSEPSRVPTLDEIREQVVFAWKTRAARDLARKKANELAASARQNPKPLREQFPDRDVQLTNAFKWYEVDLAGGSVSGRPMPTRISRVDGVEDPGDEFMQTVFELDPDKVATAMNNPQTVCYVVRLTSLNPPRPTLYDGFMVDHYQTYSQFAQADVERKSGDALAMLLDDTHLRWLREPREPEKR